MKYGLPEHTIKQIVSVFETIPQLEKVVLFGSRVKGNYKEGSDIDLVLTGRIDLSVLTEIDLKLDDLLLPYTFDIVVFDKINNQDLIEHINRVGIVVYRKNESP